MAEAAGLVVGVLGTTGLFKACIDNFDIVVRAKEFSEDFDLLCTQPIFPLPKLALQRIRLVLWGETLGLDPSSETSRVNPALDRPDIKPVVEASLNHLRLLLDKASVVTDRFELKEGNELDAPLPSWKGMALFRDRFEAFRHRIHANQKQKSVLKVTRWAVHDAAAFKQTVDKIKELIDSLESITSALENLLKRQQAALIQEIESISDTRSLRLIQKASASSQGVTNSISQRLIEDAASQMISLAEGSVAPASSGHPRSGDSFYTAPEEASTRFSNDKDVSYAMARGDSMRERLEEARARGAAQPTEAISLLPCDMPDPLRATQDRAELPALMSPAEEDPAGIPQNRRLMADLLGKTSGSFIRQPLSFGSGEGDYGSSISPIKIENERRWERSSADLVGKAHGGHSVARRVFLELRSIRLANVPFISATPLDDRLDTILASIEGPPDTPYQGGVFWISIKLPEDLARPPLVRFQTRVFHPNIDCMGKICADYQSWWDDPHLTRYLLSLGGRRGFSWFSGHSSTRYSLGALLTALCALLASPNIDDPLVPEIAETYVRDYKQYEQTARMYTARRRYRRQYVRRRRSLRIPTYRSDSKLVTIRPCMDRAHIRQRPWFPITKISKTRS
ncbi:hypothetical protein RB595_005793 [Gaeumannomyces hyphopodioides]